MTPATRPRLFSPQRPWAWLLLALVIYAPFIDTNVGTGNVASDLAAIESLVERHTFFINESHFSTIDHMRRPDGRMFSQKSPVFHLVAAVPYGVLHAAGYTLARNTALCLRVLTAVMVILPMGWLLWLIYMNPWVAAHPARRRMAFPVVFGLASLMTPFAVTFNHYAAASAFILLAVNRLIGREKHDFRSSMFIGFAISASLACDVPPAFMFGAGVAVAWLRKPKMIAALIAGAAPLALVYAALNMTILGSPLPPNMHADELQFYKGSYWYDIRRQAELGHPGFYQASYPRRLAHATVGHKGIYWMMPLLASATIAALALARRRRPGWQTALALAAYPPAAIALTMVWAFDLSGGAYLIRHVLATIAPLYIVLAHPALWPIGKPMRILSYVLVAWGGLIAWIGVIDPWSHNTLSPWPPLENVARLCLRHPDSLPTDWIAGLIERTSLTPANGLLDEGLDFFRAAAEAHAKGRNDRAYHWLVRAANTLRRATAADPKFALAYYHLGITLDMLGRSDEAIATYERLLALEPTNVEAMNNLGIFAMNGGRLERAKESWEKSLAIDPGNATAMLGLLTLEERAGHVDLNSPLLRKALTLHPKDPSLNELKKRWEQKARAVR
ncbi:tetratricopeptide repeat protein [bacterium]|nr:tetratricopeptide repeat protein [bacterium]